ncbi:hypothetical protein PoB_001489800 [Plakobranchus ocellatus]|uniref:Uncharacterized protein n=1 Tax=Plakobranchus ocellatus TaxID=259542 RepID=A0AAV3Z1A2_9GAST|nr:hypothetical protein PoB_001489800 [Plakobranchus ocellatus]
MFCVSEILTGTRQSKRYVVMQRSVHYSCHGLADHRLSETGRQFTGPQLNSGFRIHAATLSVRPGQSSLPFCRAPTSDRSGLYTFKLCFACFPTNWASSLVHKGEYLRITPQNTPRLAVYSIAGIKKNFTRFIHAYVIKVRIAKAWSSTSLNSAQIWTCCPALRLCTPVDDDRANK